MGTPQLQSVAKYKALLAGIIERRPSGTRQRLAAALSKNRSFISQITNPAYATPVPASHLDAIFDVCHFSPVEKRQFLEAYGQAHPKRLAERPEARTAAGPATVTLPDLGSEARNKKLQALVQDFVQQMVALIEQEPTKGRRP
jgi:hypothetical protein